jgi:hypothetical protein
MVDADCFASETRLLALLLHPSPRVRHQVSVIGRAAPNFNLLSPVADALWIDRHM